MSSLSVATIVVSHGEPDFLEATLNAVSQQTKVINQVVVVETAGSEACVEIAKRNGYSTIEPGNLKLGAAIDAGIKALQDQPGWLWILHDDSAPEPQALQMLSTAVELSPTVAVVGPKLLDWDNQIQIQQMGITVTATGKPFLLVESEYDQGQHDKSQDTLAVSTAGMLVRFDVWEQLGGLEDRSPLFAQDIEFCAKARAAGHRVTVEPKARVRHAGLAMKQRRTRKWTGGSRSQALSRAHVHLAGVLLPAVLLPFLYLGLPIAALLSIPQNLITKRPTRIFGQFQAWIWAWFTIGSRLKARSRIRKFGKVKPLRDFYATAQQRKKRRESKLEHEPENHSGSEKGLFASGSAWLALLPLAASWQLFPAGALYAERLVPLGSTFRDVFSATGLTQIAFLDGVNLPSDPFNWVLSFLGLFAPNNPSIALAVFVFIAPALSFLGFWFLSGLVTTRLWVRNLVALLFSLSPQLLLVSLQAGVAELVAIGFSPWLAFFIARAFLAFNSARTWRWTGLAGLAGAVVAVSNPSLFLIFLLLTLVFGLFRVRKLPIVIWYSIPGLVLLYPWLQLAIEQLSLSYLTVSSTAFLAPIDQSELLLSSVLIGVALIGAAVALIKGRLAISIFSWVTALIAWFAASYQPIAGSYVLMAVVLGALLLASATWLDTLNSKRVAGTVAMVGLVALVGATFVSQSIPAPQVYVGEPRQAPALIAASSEVNPGVRTLEIYASNEQVLASLWWGAGPTLEKRSIAYDLTLPGSEIDSQLAQLTGSLVSGNPAGVSELLSELEISFVLLNGIDEQLVSNAKAGIGSIALVQAAGDTGFGTLWQVRDAPAQNAYVLGNNRNLSLGVLAAFLLLAIPTPASIRGSRRSRGTR